MEINIQLLERGVELFAQIANLKKIVNQIGQPLLEDRSLLPEMHNAFTEQLQGVDKGTAIRAELFVMIYLYKPMMIMSGARLRADNTNVLKDIAKSVGISYGNLFKYKSTILTSYKSYRDFREVADGLFFLACEKYGEKMRI